MPRDAIHPIRLSFDTNDASTYPWACPRTVHGRLYNGNDVRTWETVPTSIPARNPSAAGRGGADRQHGSKTVFRFAAP